MAKKHSISKTMPVRYRIDPEIAHVILSASVKKTRLRQADYWGEVGPEYSDIARNIGQKVANLRQSYGNAVAEAYRQGATTMLELISLQDELEQKLKASSSEA